VSIELIRFELEEDVVVVLRVIAVER